MIASQLYLMNRHPHNFTLRGGRRVGEAEDFDPELWILAHVLGEYKGMTKSLWTYSSGPQACIGKELSLTSVLCPFLFFSFLSLSSLFLQTVFFSF